MGNDAGTFLRALELGEPGGSWSPRTWWPGDARDLRRGRRRRHRSRPGDRRAAAPLYAVLGRTNPIPVKAGLEMLGVCSARAAADHRGGRRPEGRGTAGPRGTGPADRECGVGLSSEIRILPLGADRGDRQEHDRHRARRADRGHRHRSDVPDRRHARDRSGPAGLLLAAERANDIEAIVLTHGHEDHVGALPYVLREIDPARDLRRPADHRDGPLEARRAQASRRPLQELPPGERVEGRSRSSLSTWRTRSPTPERSSSHGPGGGSGDGDYKFDQTPVDGIPSDVSRLAELGRDGVLCLCGDSTNADRPGIAPSESSVGPALLEVFGAVREDHRHLLRLQRPPRPAGDRCRPARPQGRAGRKVDAEELQHRLEPRDRIGPRRPSSRPRRSRTSRREGRGDLDRQPGEPLSALRRMAHRDHPDVELHSGDTVIFSATPIPGNEQSVNETIDRIFQIGRRW